MNRERLKSAVVEVLRVKEHAEGERKHDAQLQSCRVVSEKLDRLLDHLGTEFSKVAEEFERDPTCEALRDWAWKTWPDWRHVAICCGGNGS